ncbi:MAG: TylF/MycF/NovP-related O-methyltransferase [Inquilinus sp.]|uniref:TylF/MycF/NovP-related O-methyltransferase n=1 Tax=Inquilinus sp. TaxID=1932117 RepID=UPI003F2DA173
MKQKLKEMARSFLVPLLYRYPPTCLAPERLYLYFHYLIECKEIPGDIVEIGCAMGGTAAIARNMTRHLDINKRYLCYDTFDGFVEQQFSSDVGLGTPAQDRHMFSGSSRDLVAKILKRHKAEDVTLIQGDITTIPDSTLPESCSVVLLDVDLAEPTYQALKRFWPRLAPGGVILVDDCPESTSWKARVGYRRFCQEMGLAEQYRHGMGILTGVATH